MLSKAVSRHVGLLAFPGLPQTRNRSGQLPGPAPTRVTIISHLLLYSDWSLRIVKCFTLLQELSCNIRIEPQHPELEVLPRLEPSLCECSRCNGQCRATKCAAGENDGKDQRWTPGE